jgi:hypothetical protein
MLCYMLCYENLRHRSAIFGYPRRYNKARAPADEGTQLNSRIPTAVTGRFVVAKRYHVSPAAAQSNPIHAAHLSQPRCRRGELATATIATTTAIAAVGFATTVAGAAVGPWQQCNVTSDADGAHLCCCHLRVLRL